MLGLTIALVTAMASSAVSCEWYDDPFLSEPTAEILDGADNDCDGVIDEGLEWDGSMATSSEDRVPPAVVQLALVQADPDQLEVGDTAAVTARVRVTLDTEFKAAEFRVGGDGLWTPMTATPRESSMTKDTDVSGTTAPFTQAGEVEICVRAFDSLDLQSATECTSVTVDPAAQQITFEGFLDPVNMDDLTFRAGRAVPLKFRLSDLAGPITEPSEVEVSSHPSQRACGAAATPVDGPEDAGQSQLRSDTDESHFAFAWDTQRSWAGTCRVLEVRHLGALVAAFEVDFTR